MFAARKAGNPGRRPVLEGGCERRIAQIRPRFRRRDGVLPHQYYACLPLPQLRSPRQAGDAQLPKAGERGILQGLWIGIANLGRFQDQGTQSALAPRTNHLLAIVPNYLGLLEDLRRKILFEVRVAHGSGEKNPPLSFPAVQFRRDDEPAPATPLRFPQPPPSPLRPQVPPPS